MALDTQTDFMQILKNWETMPSSERVGQKIIGDTLMDWLGKEFLRDVKLHILASRKPDSWFEDEVFLSHEFAIAVNLLKEEFEVSGPERQRQIKIGLGIKVKQLRDALGDETFVGWVSTLTFANLLKEVINTEGVRLSDFLATPADDARNGTDFIVRFENEGRKYINLIQLKSNGIGSISLDPLTEFNTSDDGVHIDSRSRKNVMVVRKMLDRAEEIKAGEVGKGNLDTTVKCFIVEVPSCDSRSVNNDVFGRVQASEIIEKFVADCNTYEFFPK